MKDMLKAEIQQKPHLGKAISAALHRGEPVPDAICIQLVEQRLKQSDCKVNGWILDGFPQSEAQVNLLKAMRLKPSLVCLFEQTEQVSVNRLKNRRVDPQTGVEYNLETKQAQDPLVEARLLAEAEDREEAVKKRFAAWTLSLSLMEETYKQILVNLQSDRTPEQLEEQICDAIQNPLF
jgi:adenylate kinase